MRAIRSMGAHALALVTALGAVLLSSAPVRAGEVLEVRLSDDVPGGLTVGVRDAADQVPVVKIDEAVVPTEAGARTSSKRWQPLVLMIDTANVSQEILDRVKANVENVVTRQFAEGAQLVVIADQIGNSLDLTDPETALKSLGEIMATWRPVEVPRGSKTAPTEIGGFLPLALRRALVTDGRPWAVVYSSLCVPDDAAGMDLSTFKGPVRFLTWDTGLNPACPAARERWLAGTKGDNKQVLHIDRAEDKDAVGKALLGLEASDASLALSGWEYAGKNFSLSVSFPGEANPWTGTFTPDSVPSSWSAAAALRSQRKTKIVVGLCVSVLLVAMFGFVVVQARAGAVEVEKWEAVGDAEDLSTQLDPDAWNSTIFQLTGAMPVLRDIQNATQLGPAPEPARAPRPSPVEPIASKAPAPEKTAKASKPAKAATPEDAGATMLPGEGPSPSGEKKTGMTVAMPVLDDGTGYEADHAFEIGVLLSGKPVARKTKKFKKVFSVGRATDNRVVIQKDDTVHRYHVVVRPALKGKEWWLEVSPTATNRTNLNGKDLRAGGRYKLPSRFRLQLGEATEIRGRLADT